MKRPFILFLLYYSLVSCSTDEENTYIGTWQCDSLKIGIVTIHITSIIKNSDTSMDIHKYQLNPPEKDFIEFTYINSYKINNNILTNQLLSKEISNRSETLEKILSKEKQLKLLNDQEPIGSIKTSKIISKTPKSITVYSPEYDKKFTCNKITTANKAVKRD